MLKNQVKHLLKASIHCWIVEGELCRIVHVICAGLSLMISNLLVWIVFLEYSTCNVVEFEHLFSITSITAKQIDIIDLVRAGDRELCR